MYFVYLILLYFYINYVDCAKILAISTSDKSSDNQFIATILSSLTQNHEIFFLTPYLTTNYINYTEINTVEILGRSKKSILKMREQYNQWDLDHPFFEKKSIEICEKFKKFKILQDLLHESFDLIIIEPFYSNCMSFISKSLKAPEIYVISSRISNNKERLFLGTESNPSYVPHILTNYTILKNIKDRFINTGYYWYTNIMLWYQDLKNTFLTNSLNHKPSIIFTNSHYLLDSYRPILPTLIPIGGVHISIPKLNDDILNFINSNPNGFIYFVFGSEIKISSLDKNTILKFINVFSKLPYNVLMAYDGIIDFKIPKNILIKNWFNQRSVLNSQELKLFINNGGLNSMYEALFFGVPVLGTPLYGDQYKNIQYLVDYGIAKSIDIFTITEDLLTENINTIISDEKYTNNALHYKNIFSDKINKHLYTVNYWVEYVLKYKNVKHLHSKAYDTPWYQYLSFDIYLIINTVVFLIIYLIFKILHIFFTCCSNN